MNRTRFFGKVTVDDIDQLDFLDHNLSNFVPVNDPSFYIVRKVDRKRPDLISYRSYNTVYYWWLICLHNSIDNPFTDILVGATLEIPSVMDVFNFSKNYRKR